MKLRRKELDLTQAELAQRAGCSVPAVRKIETGERRPSKQLAELLAQSLGIPAEDRQVFIRVARGELNVERLHLQMPFRAADRTADQVSPLVQINLPFQPTPLIGREAELAALAKLMADPKCRLLTVTGMGGIGKTRLAIELAFTQQSLFPGGVHYVTLASLDAPEFIIPAISDVLGISFSGSLDHREQLLNYLTARTRQALLLVLDNLEHLLMPATSQHGEATAALLLTEMLQRIPNLKILATSRELINIQGEWIFELRGLPVPTYDQSQDLANYSAAALFIQRAKQAKADFEVLPDERPSLVRICRLVEGTPLAIELASAWVRILPIHEIEREITANLDFLAISMRDVSERHRSLRATFNHSWKLLTPEEQRVLSRIAVFRGGFQRQAAERVAGASLSILMSLFSKSLLLHRADGRYDLHEVIRRYALAYLQEGPQGESTRDFHCEYYLELVRGQEKGFGEATQWVDVSTLVEELDNLRAAMAWGAEKSQAECTLQIATALGQFWHTQGYWQEGLEWLERGLDNSIPIHNEVRAKALTVAGRLMRHLGDYTQAAEMLRTSLDLWHRCDDQTGIAQTLCNLGATLLRQGEHEVAVNLLDEALSVASRQGDRRGVYCSLENLGHAASGQGNSLRAIELYTEAITLAREAKDEHQVANLLNAEGDEYVLMGDYDRAEDCFSMGAEICRRLGNRLIGAYISGNRGFVAMKQGNYSRAFELLAETISVLQELGDKEHAILTLEPMAYVVKAQHFPDRAARLLGASESLRESLGVIRSQPNQADYDIYLVDTLNQLGEDAFEAARVEGSRMTLEQAMAYALDQPWSA